MKKTWLALVGLFALAYVFPLGVRPFMIPDETRYAEIPREMLASGDWIVPRLAGVRYFEKPVLGYWLNAVSMAVLGDNRFAARLPSALSAGLTALLLFVLVRRSTRDHFAGTLSAGALLVCPMVFAFGVFNFLDNALSLFLTAAMVSFFFAYTAVSAREKTVCSALFGACVGLAFLTKGFLAFVVPAVAIAPFLVWERRWKGFYEFSLLPALVALIVALPWCIAVHLREPTFWNYFFWVEHVKRFMSDNPQHPAPVWYFVPHLVWSVLPWLAVVPAAVIGGRKNQTKGPLIRFAWCWFLFPFLFFSASQGKIATYILPCLPPLIVLIALGLTRCVESNRRRAFTLGAAVMAVAAGLSAVILALSQWTGIPGFRIYADDESWKALVLTAGVLTWFLLLLLAVRARESRRGIAFFCAGPVALMVGAHFVFPSAFEEIKMPGRFLISHADRVEPGSIVVSDAELAVAASYYYKRTDVYVLENGGELAWGLGYEDAKGRVLTLDRFRELATNTSDENRVIVIAYKRRFDEYRNLVPRPLFEDSFGRFVFARF